MALNHLSSERLIRVLFSKDGSILIQKLGFKGDEWVIKCVSEFAWLMKSRYTLLRYFSSFDL